MTVLSPPWAIQGEDHEASIATAAVAAFMGAPAAAHAAAVSVTTAGGAHGVVDAPDLAVTQNGTPNMSVNVAAGHAIIRSGGSDSLQVGSYTFLNDATLNVSVSASDPTNPRIDYVIAQVRDLNYGEAASDARLVVVAGTPAASPSAPSLTSYPNCLVLAQIAVAAAVTTIVTANIADKRTRAYAVGGVCVCTSTTRPTGASLHDGLEIFETDTKEYLVYYATAAVWRKPWMMPWGVLGVATLSSTVTNTTVADTTGLSVAVTNIANRRVRVTLAGQIYSSVGSDGCRFLITDGSNTELKEGNVMSFTNGWGTTANLIYYESTSAGAKTYKARHGRSSGSTGNITWYSAAGSVGCLIVEDIGPASATPA